ncbi:zinc ribbon domain-containing protein [Thioalkalivibrio sp. HK1]|uniref:zinc ribbon domain-containing protein n=1 Tax=Thioalkalivibrio sp. HK1 TaxID=1469245 RepID=UPI0004723E45|nr:zinc ribbon domain-containing protein [Thioalkalivibrio sp. HK1]
MTRNALATDAAVGIHAFGGYIPKRRLQKKIVAKAHAWFNPALAAHAKGERAIADWDEDAITMAVEAARDCLGGDWSSSLLPPRTAAESEGEDAQNTIAHAILASTTFPFQDRQNAGVVAEALRLGRRISTLDIGGSQRAGTSALITAFEIAAGGRNAPLLVSGSEKRRTRAASPLEFTSGDAAAALLVAPGEGVARLLAHATCAVDFVDHYRGPDAPFDYVWEERWIRDEGLMKIVPETIADVLSKAGLEARAIDHFCLPSALRGAGAGIVKATGLPAESLCDNLQGVCGEAGAAHPLVMLSHILESTPPERTILVVGFGQGCDAILLRTTSALAGEDGKRPGPRLGIGGHLKRRFEDTNYQRYLGTNDLLQMEQGLRSEVDRQTGLTTLYRNREMIHGLVGGRCTRCGTRQFPKSGICVNPNCHADDTQVDHSFSETPASMRSYTADRLTWSMAPPAYYGMVQFEGGGQAMIDFADIEPGGDSAPELEPGAPMRMVFRIKDLDPRRGFRRYFWKAAPAGTDTIEGSASDNGEAPSQTQGGVKSDG